MTRRCAWVALVSLLAVSACVQDGLVPCGDTSCPVGLVCGPQGGCATEEQIQQCEGKADGAECGDSGVCDRGICTPARCGDGVVAFQEECEVGAELTCAEVGGYGTAPATCASDCTSDVTSCARCGDGLVQAEHEACDGRPTVSCSPLEIGYFECNGCDNVGRCAVLGFAQFELQADVLATWAASRTELYALGRTQLFRSNGGSFTVEDLLPTLAALGASSEELRVGWGRSGALWVAGTGGVLLRHDGASWSRIAIADLPAPPPELIAAHEDGPSSAIVIGDGGTIIELTGTTATRVATGLTTVRLRAVSGDATIAYAVGANATVLRREAGVWSVDPAAASLDPATDLVAVWARGPGRVLAVDAAGDVYERAAPNGVPTWSRREEQPPARLRSMWGSAADDIFAVGADPATGDQLLHFDGDAWVVVERGAADPPPTGAGAAIPGGGQIVARPYGVAMFDAVWAAYGPATTAVYRIGDERWRTDGRKLYRNGEYVLGATHPLIHVFGVGADRYVLMNRITSPPATLPIRLDGLIYRLDGTQLTQVGELPGTQTAGRIGLGAGARVFVLDFPGVLYEVTSPGVVEQISSTLTWGPILHGWGSAADDVYVVGTEGIRHWNGTAWSAPIAAAGTDVYAIWGSGPNDVHAVGTRAIHFDGTAWTALTQGSFVGSLFGLDGRRSNDLYAISMGVGGNAGVVRHFDGRGWRDISAFSTLVTDGSQVAVFPTRVVFTTQLGVRTLIHSTR